MAKNLTPEYREYIRSPAWSALRTARLKKDNFRCQRCGSPLNLQVHHIRYPVVLGTESVDSDLITLCERCHEQIEQEKDAWRDVPYRQQKENTEALYKRFWADIEAEDKGLGGQSDFCKFEVIEKRWREWLVCNGLIELLDTRPIPKMATQEHFRDLRIEKIFLFKAQGAQPDDVIRSGVSTAMVYKYWNHKDYAEKIIGHKLEGGTVMNKPGSYDEVQVGGDFTPVALGGHYCEIKQVTETQSKSGKDMIVVVFDFCSPDKQKGYFSDAFKNDTREDKKWPANGRKYIMVNDYQDPNKVSRNFKSFCTAVEKSNNYEIHWGDNWGDQFKGKKIGAVFGEVENEYNGKVSMRHELRWFCNTDKVSSAAIPDPKYLNGSGPSTSNSGSGSLNGFMSVPEGTAEEIPF